MTTLKLEHPAVAALRGVVREFDARKLIVNHADARSIRDARSALIDSAAYAEAVAECVAALGGTSIMLQSTLKEYADEPWAQRVSAALAKIAKAGVR